MPAPKHTIEEQEKLILDAAAQCILDSSLIDFKMSAIAKEAVLSMGSVYKHIQSKEDVLVALSVRVDRQAHAIIREILQLPYSLPSKIVAINLVSQEAMYTYDFSYQMLSMLNSKDLLAKASQNWLSKFHQVSADIRGLFQEALLDAMHSDELLCADNEKETLIEEFLLLHWAINLGYPQILNHPHETQIGQTQNHADVDWSLDHPLVKAMIRMTNSYPWKTPLELDELNELEQVLSEKGWR